MPDQFTRQRDKLKAFLTQAELYVRYNASALPTQSDRVLAVAAYLRGEAFDWFEPRIKEFLEKGMKGCTEDTKGIF